MVKIILKPGKEQSVLRFHPWIFSGAIKKTEGNPAEGDLVELYSANDQFLAIGHYQIGSITVRIISFEQVAIDAGFWYQKLQQAYQVRKTIGVAENSQNNVYRLIHGEGDGLPGLIIDIYNDTAVMQMHSVGMFRIRQILAQTLKDLFGDKLKAVYDKSESTIPFKANTGAKNEYVLGNSQPCEVLEYNNKFMVDWI